MEIIIIIIIIFFALIEFVRLYLPIEPFAQGNILYVWSQCAFLLYPNCRVEENLLRMPLKPAGLNFLTFLQLVRANYCILSPVQYLGISMLWRYMVAGSPLRNGCRVGLGGFESSIVSSVFSCSACDVQVVYCKKLSNMSGFLLFVSGSKNKVCLLYLVWFNLLVI